VNLGARVTPEEKKLLRRIARDRDTTIQQLISDALQIYKTGTPSLSDPAMLDCSAVSEEDREFVKLVISLFRDFPKDRAFNLTLKGLLLLAYKSRRQDERTKKGARKATFDLSVLFEEMELELSRGITEQVRDIFHRRAALFGDRDTANGNGGDDPGSTGTSDVLGSERASSLR
jgi:hypothetical protein